MSKSHKGPASKKKKVSSDQSSKIDEPKKPLTAFKIFSLVKTEFLHGRHPTWSTKQLDIRVKILWKQTVHRAKYEKLARDQLDEYQEEMMTYYARTSQFVKVQSQAKEWLGKIRILEDELDSTKKNLALLLPKVVCSSVSMASASSSKGPGPMDTS